MSREWGYQEGQYGFVLKECLSCEPNHCLCRFADVRLTCDGTGAVI